MRKIKSFNEYQNINEEIGVKSIAAILTSLLLTFKSVEKAPSFKAATLNVTSFSSEEDQEKSMNILNQDMMKIQNDLQKIKNSGYNDQKLNIDFKIQTPNNILNALTKHFLTTNNFNKEFK